MKKRILSIVLAMSMIASVVVFCLAGPASAVQNTIKYPVYDEAVSLAAKPTVNLTFEGDNCGGIPIGRYTNGVKYVDGYAKVTSTTGWVFFGKDGSVGKTTVRHDAEGAKTALGDLFMLEVDHTYSITMKYKKLAGATVTKGTGLNYGIAADPTAGPAQQSAEYIKDVVKSGLTVVWNVDGAAQEAGTVLEKDTDWQTLSLKLTAVKSGAFGFQPNGGGYYAFDDFKIYDLTALGNSFQNPITFDNGGIVSTRAMSLKASYHKDGYAIIPDNGNCFGAAFIGMDNEYNKDIAQNKDKIADADSLYHSKMFKFLPGQSYKITFKYRYAAGSYVVNGAIPRLKLQMAPNGAAKGYDDLWNKYGIPKEGSFAKDVFVTGLECVTANAEKTTAIAEDTPWQNVTITFTVRDDITSIQGYEDFTGAYFGIGVGQSGDNHGMTGVTANRTLHIDDYNVEELNGYKLSSVSLGSKTVSFDFDGEEPAYSASAGTVEFPSENGNTYMKYSGGGRMSFDGTNGTNVLKAGNKYYISFDAKSDDGCQHFNFVMGNQGSSSSNYRIFFNGNAGLQTALKNSGSKFYINGEEVDGYTNFKPSSEWQHFGFVLNLDSTAWTGVNSPSGSPNTFNDAAWKNLEKSGGVYFLFGATTGTSVCYDNIKISQFDEIANAVPATDGQVYRDTYTYSNDFDSITTSNLTQNTADKAEVGADASAPERGNIIKILSGGSRLTVNDTNVFEKDYKYTISFDAKLDPDSATDTSRMYAIFAPINSLHNPRYFIMDTGSGCTNPDVLGAFKFYIDGQESTWKDFAIDKNWKTYTIEFDYTNESFLAAASSESTNTDIKAQMKGLSNAVSYFHFGCANGWFDNLKIVKRDIGEIKSNTQVSVRKESGSGENYVSAGLRFKNCLPNDVVAAADEIGFVVIPSSMAVTAPDTWYKMDGTGSASAQTVVCKNATMNQMYERTASETYYQLVLTGLSTESGKTAYNRRFSAVLYVKNGDTYTYHALGETSYNQVGAIKDVINAQ